MTDEYTCMFCDFTFSIKSGKTIVWKPNADVIVKFCPNCGIELIDPTDGLAFDILNPTDE